jgi:hypothetical protein
LIPDRISQTTGQPVTATHPGYRAFAGVGSTQRDFISEEVKRIGVPGSTVYLKETGDYGLDRYLAEQYARLLQQHLPPILESEQYQQLATPARQRDFLQQYVFPVIKRGALDSAKADLGLDRFQAATVTGEGARRKQRQARLIEGLQQELPRVETEEIEVPGEPEPADDPVPERPF